MRAPNWRVGGHRNILVVQPGSTEAIGGRNRAREAKVRPYVAYRNGRGIDLAWFVPRTHPGGRGKTGRRVPMKRPVDIVPRYGVAALAVGVALALWLFLDPLVTDQSPFLLAGPLLPPPGG